METAGTATTGGTRRMVIFAALTLGLLALIASSVSATSAYFSDTEVRSTVISTGEVDISVTGLGNGILDYNTLMPGESVSSTFTVTNDAPGDGPVDLYTWVEFGDPQTNLDGDPVDLCGQITVSITDVGGTVPTNSNDICDVAADLEDTLSGFGPVSATTVWPLQINKNASPLNGSRTYTVTLTLNETAGNALANFTSDESDKLVVYATQAGKDAPAAGAFDDYSAVDVFTQ